VILLGVLTAGLAAGCTLDMEHRERLRLQVTLGCPPIPDASSTPVLDRRDGHDHREQD